MRVRAAMVVFTFGPRDGKRVGGKGGLALAGQARLSGLKL